ncbi:hypothetical protein E3N88_05085 [Mikania micrantha]|uniref:AB hydrolase-1 domain-containing protein n=1 Tax=Mikania micrantha TaxID=192012 RepID=A0A5N6PXR5_9ASTR|nr:hypothetical protein E3N88_05085 [Mikania micrantha]
MVRTGDQQTHFVLVHGACHGAWCWFKLKPLLEAAGHRVSAFDLSASGINTKTIQQVATLSEYSKPLLEFMTTIPPEEKVVLVGHSLGGMNVSLAMEKFPEKVAVGVFLTAFMPDSDQKFSYVLDKGGRGRENDRGRENQTQWKSWRNKDGIQPEEHVDKESTKEGWQHVRRNNQGGNRLQRNYQLKEKATSFFLQNLPEELSEKELWRECINYGHVVDAYIVKELKHVDHMPMLCDPKQLSVCLVDVAKQYA